MAIQTCPTDIVAAPVERIWDQLTHPEKLARWTGTTLIDGPSRSLTVGDRVVLGPGLGMKAVLEVLAMEPLRQFTVEVRLPFGVVNHEIIQIAQVDAGRYRVTFN